MENELTSSVEPAQDADETVGPLTAVEDQKAPDSGHSLLGRLLGLAHDRGGDAEDDGDAVDQTSDEAGGASAGVPADNADGDLPGPKDDEDESSLLGALTGVAETAAGTVGKAVTQTTSTIIRGAEGLAAGAARGAGGIAAGAARRIDERAETRNRRMGRQARDPLPLLWEAHPDAVNASRRDVGLVTVPLEQIRGTAVEGSQRGGDFKPIPTLRGANWQGRWRRIMSAINRLEALPPVDLLKTGNEFWVIDGHNRVAAALDLDQVALDANVIELLVPGMPREPMPTDAGMYLAEGMRDVRAAGEGRRSRTAAQTIDLEDTEALRRQFDHDHDEVSE